MKKRLGKIIFVILVCVFLPAVSYGQLITIGIEAVVNNVTDNDNLLEGKVTIGGTITGTYTYDTSTPDTNPASEYSDYWYYNSPSGLELTVGGFVFKTDPDNVKFLIGVANNSQGYQDNYLVRNYNNLSLSNGTLVNHISWQLDDYSGAALSSTALPIAAPILSDWDWDYNILCISGGIGGTPPCYDKTFYIGAEVVSAVLIPEPMSLFIFGFGLLALRKPK